MIDNLLVNGTALENKARIVQDWDQARGIPARRPTNITVPNRDGEVWMPKSRQPKMMTVAMTILGCDPVTGKEAKTLDGRRRQFNANWRDFVRLVTPTDKPLTLTRVVGFPGGLVEKHTAQAEVEGTVDPVMITPDACALAVTFKLLDSVWFGDASDTLGKQDPPKTGANATDGEITLTCPGDTVTWSMDVYLSGGTDQKLTNLDTGDSVQVTGSTAGDEVRLWVPEYRATNKAGENVISRIVTGDTQLSPYWMTLLPGPNRLTLTGGGTARLVYRGAFL